MKRYGEGKEEKTIKIGFLLTSRDSIPPCTSVISNFCFFLTMHRLPVLIKFPVLLNTCMKYALLNTNENLKHVKQTSNPKNFMIGIWVSKSRLYYQRAGNDLLPEEVFQNT